jgi:hypothetical protein
MIIGIDEQVLIIDIADAAWTQEDTMIVGIDQQCHQNMSFTLLQTNIYTS